MSGRPEVLRLFKYVSGVLTGAHQEACASKYVAEVLLWCPNVDQSCLSFALTCDALAEAIRAGAVPQKGIKTLLDLAEKLPDHGITKPAKLYEALGLSNEFKTAAKKVFDCVAGVLNGAFVYNHALVAEYSKYISVWNHGSEDTFACACEALARAVEDGFVPDSGKRVLTDLADKLPDHNIGADHRLCKVLGLDLVRLHVKDCQQARWADFDPEDGQGQTRDCSSKQEHSEHEVSELRFNASSKSEGKGKPGQNKCYTCGKVGHFWKDCPNDHGRGRDVVKKGGACYNCGDPTHLVRDCPLAGKSKGKNTARVTGKRGPLCNSYKISGKCSWGDACRFSHG